MSRRKLLKASNDSAHYHDVLLLRHRDNVKRGAEEAPLRRGAFMSGTDDI